MRCLAGNYSSSKRRCTHLSDKNINSAAMLHHDRSASPAELSEVVNGDVGGSMSFQLHIELKPRSLVAVIERLEVFSRSPDAICYSRRPADDMASMVLFFDHASDPVRQEIKSWLNQLVGVRTCWDQPS